MLYEVITQPARCAGGAHHARRLLEGVRHLLLAVDVQPGLQAGVGVLRVHPVGGGDQDGVELPLFIGSYNFV